MPVDTSIRERLAPAIYGLIVFAGTLLLGWVVLPLAAVASGAFASDADARAFFSFATLKGVPYLAGGGVLSTLVQPYLAGRRWPARIAITGLNIVVCWLIAAGIAIAMLG